MEARAFYSSEPGKISLEKEQIEGCKWGDTELGGKEKQNFKLKLTDVKATFPYQSVQSEVGALWSNKLLAHM